MSKIKNDNFITIQGYMVNELDLKGNKLIIYALINGFTQNIENQYFTGSLNYIAEWTNSTKQGVLKALNELEKDGLIERIRYTENDVKKVKYYTTKFNRGGKQSLIVGSKQSLPNNIEEDNIYKKDTKVSKKEVVTNDSLKTWWNELASANGLPTLRLFNNSRKQHLMSRVKEVGSLEELQKQVKYNIEHSTFLKGYNDREWKVDFDWVVNPTNFAKLIEGKYLSQDLKQKTEEQNKPKTDWSQYDKYF